MNKTKAISAAVCLLASSLSAQTYPLSQNFWSNPEFQDRVMGSYGMHSQLEPRLSDEEGEFFKTLMVVLDGNLDEGEKMLRENITAESSPALNFMLGTINMQSGDLPSAIGSYEEAIRKFPNFMRAYKNLGIAYIQDGQLEKGTEALIKGMELGGADGLSYGLLGYCYLNLGLHSSALNAYRLALAFDPRSKDWKLGIIRCLIELESYQEASGLIKELIVADPLNHELYMHLANVDLASEEIVSAMANLEIVRRLSGGTEASLFLLADIYANRGMFELAINAYEDALGLTKDKEDRFSSISRAIRAFVENEAWDEADRLAQVAARSMGDDISRDRQLELLNMQAEIQLGADNSDAAAETLEKIIEEDPMNGRAILLLAQYYSQKGEREQAGFLFERAAGIDDVAAMALLRHGQMLVELAQYSEAVKLIRGSLDLEYQPNVADYLRAIEEATQRL